MWRIMWRQRLPEPQQVLFCSFLDERKPFPFDRKDHEIPKKHKRKRLLELVAVILRNAPCLRYGPACSGEWRVLPRLGQVNLVEGHNQ